MVTSRLWLLSLASAVAVICWTPNSLAQETPIPPSKAPVPPGHDPFVRINRAEIERGKPTTSSVKPIPATTPDSMALPEFRARGKGGVPRPPAVSRSPSVRELIEIVRRRPGGAQLLERARRSGAQIPSGASNETESSHKVVARGGPNSPDAFFDLIDLKAPPPITATVTRSTTSVTVAGIGYVSAQALYPLYATNDPVWGPLDRVTYAACPVGGSCVARSWVSIYLNATSTGWYLINVQATPIAAEMRMYSNTAPVGYNVVTLFPYPTTAGYSSYPVLLYLAAGSHSLAWVNRDFFAYVSEVSITKM
jgi:hypothetical protein